MQTYAVALVWAVVAYVLANIINARLKARAFAREERLRGCKPPPMMPNDWPFGVNVIRAALKADATNKFPEFIDRRLAKMQNRTHRFQLLGATGVSTVDPKNVQAVLATQFDDFQLGARRRGTFFPLLGNGIFTTDGKMWEHSRAMLRPQFARDQVADLQLEEKHVQNLMYALPVRESGWTDQTDLSPLFFRLTIDSACQFLFGESVDSQLLNIPEYAAAHPPKSDARDEKAFTFAFDNAQRTLATRARFQDFYWLISTPAFRRNCKTVHRFIDEFVKIALDKRNNKVDVEKVTSDAKPRYVFLDALAAQTQDPIELRSQLLNILLAGRDTTAGLLGWTMWEMARHPEMWTKLRAAVIADFGEYNETLAGEAISFAKLKGCSYLQHVINESLRLHSVVPFNLRLVAKDYTTLPRGGGEDGMSPILVQRGEAVEYSVHVMHRLESIWGPDAKQYNPGRWHGRRPGWEFLPFNGGPRICLGQQFALTEASYVLTRLAQRFDQIQNLDFSEMTHNLTLTDAPGGGVKVRLHQAPNVS